MTRDRRIGRPREEHAVAPEYHEPVHGGVRHAERAVQPRRRLEQKLARVKRAALTSVRDVGEREADQPGCDEERLVDRLGTRGRSRGRKGERVIGAWR